MKEAIRRAIEGGWSPFGSILVRGGTVQNPQKWGVPEVMANFYHQPTFLLDPLFWQALGKAEGWGGNVTWVCTDTCDYWCNDCSLGFKNQKECPPEFKGVNGTHIDCPRAKHWIENWHRFIDHIAEGKDVDLFFKELLK